MRDSLSEFTDAYIACAFWVSEDDVGEFLDKNYDRFDLSDSAYRQMVNDCRSFYIQNEESIIYDDSPSVAHAGHDFWLTRNGHGAGFWDGDWQEPQATILTDSSKSFGECCLYIGDDGKIYLG